MSDFINNFWSVYVAAITLIGIFGCLLLLILVARKKVVPSGDNTTGHVWDEDLRELNNPMPKWWMGLFVITVVFSLGYLVVYPVWAASAASWTGARPAPTTRKWPRPRRTWSLCMPSSPACLPKKWPGPSGHGHWRAPVHEQLCAMPRL
jgi:hypothetical protein